MPIPMPVSMDGWIVLFRRLPAYPDIELAAHGVLDPGEVPLAADPERPDAVVIPRVEVWTPDPYIPAHCWAFSSEADANAALAWLMAHGQVGRIEAHAGMIVVG